MPSNFVPLQFYIPVQKNFLFTLCKFSIKSSIFVPIVKNGVRYARKGIAHSRQVRPVFKSADGFISGSNTAALKESVFPTPPFMDCVHKAKAFWSCCHPQYESWQEHFELPNYSSTISGGKVLCECWYFSQIVSLFLRCIKYSFFVRPGCVNFGPFSDVLAVLPHSPVSPATMRLE